MTNIEGKICFFPILFPKSLSQVNLLLNSVLFNSDPVQVYSFIVSVHQAVGKKQDQKLKKDEWTTSVQY